ncbi:hypothetical protein R1sor_018416 [Riccia sorocarpa]|uniref:Uncharacterized protein n=1 Tax=Riccia sorocarpa TaxID=122646 RepID=A0ABD3ICX3_9MARC
MPRTSVTEKAGGGCWRQHSTCTILICAEKSSNVTWTLRAGKRYRIFGIVDSNVQPGDVGISTRDVQRRASTFTGPSGIDEGASTSFVPTTWPGIPPDPSIESLYSALKHIRGRSELSRLNLDNFTHMLVLRLPGDYNGNVIFELPPMKAEDLQKKGAILDGMDRSHDCWISTKCTTTSAALGSQRADYNVNRIHCVGSLQYIPIVLNGDIRTRTVKRKSAYSTGIGKNDTHRHDKVAVTQQAVRYVRGRLHFGPEIDSPPTSPTRAFARDHLPTDAGPSTGRKHDTIPQTPRTDPNVPFWNPLHELPERPARVAVTSDNDVDNSIGDDRTEHQPVHLPQTEHQSARVAVTADVDGNEGNVHDGIQHQVPQHHKPREAVNHVQTAPRPVRVDLTTDVYAQEDICHDRTAHPVHTVSSDTSDKALSDTSSDVEIIESTPRQRPPTRARPVFQQPLLGPVQYGIQVTEREVNINSWHLSRSTTSGAGPACFGATPGRSSPRALCKTKIRHAGLVRHGVGVVVPSFMGKHKYMAVERDYWFWFCPNGRCHKGPGANSCKTQMPMVPDIMPVQRGTHLTQEEVDFLTDNEITLVRRPDANMDQETHIRPKRRLKSSSKPTQKKYTHMPVTTVLKPAEEEDVDKRRHHQRLA